MTRPPPAIARGETTVDPRIGPSSGGTPPGPAAGAAAPRTALAWLLVAAAVAATVLRQPAYLLEPSFFAEEGTTYFVRAWHAPWHRALLQAPSGYFLLFTNLAAVCAAHLVALRHAPQVTTLLALVVQLAPVASIAFGAAPEWRSTGRKAVGIAIVLFASLSDEIWLNTINSQCYFAVLAVLILLEPADASPARTWVNAGLLALCGASGPVAASLAPLYALQAWLSRRRAPCILAIVISTCLLVQVATVVATRGGPYFAGRGSGIHLVTVGGQVWMRSLILPVLGPRAAESFARGLLAWTGGDLGSPLAMATGAVLLGLAGGTVVWLARPLAPSRRVALAGSYLVITCVVTLLASGNQRRFLESASQASRYFYAPGVVLLLLLAENAWLSCPVPRGSRVRACGVLLGVGLALGIARFRTSTRWQPDWPRWTDQVLRWEREPRERLLIWPPGWAIVGLRPQGTPPGPWRRRGSPRAPRPPASHPSLNSSSDTPPR